MRILLLILFILFVHASLLIPGYAYIRRLRVFADKPGIELCAAYLLTMAVMGSFAMAGYMLGIPQLVIQLLLVSFFVVGTVLFILKKNYLDLLQFKFPLFCLLLISTFSLVFTQLSLSKPYDVIPDPQPVAGSNYAHFDVKILSIAQTNANDNSIPYRQAQFINNRSDPARDSFIDEWGVHFFQRTPLMGSVSAAYFTLLGEKLPIGYIWNGDSKDPKHTYLQFQAISSVINNLFVLPGFFLLALLFKRKTAMVALLLMVPSHYFLFNAFFSWPKSLVAFFVLFSWWLILEKRFRYLLLAAVASGLAYLTHDLAVLYLGTSLLLLIFLRRYRDTLVYMGVTLVFMIPWVIASSIIYNKPSTFIYYPLSTGGIPQYADRHRVIEQFFDTNPLRLIAIRLDSLLYLLSPYQLLTSEGGQTIPQRLWGLLIFSIPGSVTLGLFAAAIVGFIKKRSLQLALMIFIPILACVAVIGWPRGLGSIHFAEAIVVILFGLGAWWLLGLRQKFWLLLAYGLSLLHLVHFTVFAYSYQWRTWFTEPLDILILLYMVAVAGVCGWLIYAISYNKQLLPEKLKNLIS